jgi:sulfide:quinone oxidoreductase
VKSVTIAGGGIAALEAVLALRAHASDVPIQMLAPQTQAAYRPLAVLEPFSAGETPELNLGRFADEHGVTLRRDTLVAVDPEAKTLVTGQGERLPFDVLLVAAGARMVETLPRALVFRGHDDSRQISLMIDEIISGKLSRVAFAVPDGQAWSLPAYELALLTAATLRARNATADDLSIVTAEPAPLGLFGERASASVATLLDEAGVTFHGGSAPARIEDWDLVTSSGARIKADRVVALPRLAGPAFPGLPGDEQGFIPTDEHCRVEGVDDVYAAGDVTAFPVKQGGLATQQADAAAEAIAAGLGYDVTPEPFQPVLRGLLLSGTTAQPIGDRAGTPFPALFAASHKVAGRYLIPYVAGDPDAEPLGREGMSVHIDLTPFLRQGA